MNFLMTPSSTEEQTEGGRFDFDDGGSYVGDWCDAKAHGLGLVTGPRGQGQFAGQWENGFESCGVYIWPSGNTYEGQWLHGKRQGVGVERKGRWVYMGDWTTGFKGRYGVRESIASGAKYEGAWNTGLQEGLGVETYADGGTFAGMWLHGTREGAGVRQSVPYGLACHYRDERCLRDSLTSMRSVDDDENSVLDRQRKIDEARGGFVLLGRGDPNHPPLRKSLDKQQQQSQSLTKKTLLNKLRKQRSTGDINESPQRHPHRRQFSGSIRSNISSSSQLIEGSGLSAPAENNSFWVEDIVDPNITERYMGHWKQDKRSGFGVSERSDGLQYFGEWMNNKKHGYGITYFPDSSYESGKYKMNVLVLSTAKRNKLFALRTSRLKDRVNEVKMQAELAQTEAKKKEALAFQKQATARECAQAAWEMAKQARNFSKLAQQKSRDFAPDFYQPGDEYLKRREESENAGEMVSSVLNKSNEASNRRLLRQPAISIEFEHSSVPQMDSRSGPTLLNAKDVSKNGSCEIGGDLLSPNILCDGALQVGGGGSRRGSFRAIRRNSLTSRVAENDRQEAKESIPSMSQPKVCSVMADGMTNTNCTIQKKVDGTNVPIRQEANAKLSDLLNSTTLTDHFDQYSLMRHKRDSGLGRDSSLEESTNDGTNVTSASGIQSSAPRCGSEMTDSGVSDMSGASKIHSRLRLRRRTLPSLMTAPPVKPVPVNKPPDECVHSLENLVNGDTTTTYIIENGIRKRVEAEYSPPASQAFKNSDVATLQRRRILDQFSLDKKYATDDIPNLPRRYRIESQAPLAKDLGEGSIPDVSVCRHIKQHSLMTREEVSRLSQARRQELLRQELRRRQGEIVIHLADLKQTPRLPLDDPFRHFVAKHSWHHSCLINHPRFVAVMSTKTVINALSISEDEVEQSDAKPLLHQGRRNVPKRRKDVQRSKEYSFSKESKSTLWLGLTLLATASRYQIIRLLRFLLPLSACHHLQDWCREHFIVLAVLCINSALAFMFLTFLAAPRN